MQGDPLINLRSKEQEAELVRQTLAALTAMRIRFPGKSEEEAESVLDEVSAFLLDFVSRVPSHCRVVPPYCALDRSQGESCIRQSSQSGEAWRSDQVQVLLAPLYSQSPLCGQVRSLCRPHHPPHQPPNLLHSPLTIAARVGLAPIVFQTTPLTTCLQRRPFPAAPRCSFILISAASSICTARTSLSFRPEVYLCACTCLAALCSSRRLNKLFREQREDLRRQLTVMF